MKWHHLDIDERWTLFLDRDGVINKKIPGEYVRSWEQFEWIEGVKEAIAELTNVFGYIFIVTNQQGIGKKLMTELELQNIHNNMMKEISKAGGKIDKIYHCPAIEQTQDPCRKPGIGMALMAKKDFPVISFTKSIMAGDSVSDMEFGTAASMKRVLIQQKNSLDIPRYLYDFKFESLKDFADDLNGV